MQAQATLEIFDWLKPSPLWSADGSDLVNGDLFRPRLLTFSTDNFVSDFVAAVKQSALGKPQPLSGLLLNPPGAGKPALRLYQPAHGIFQLICASLCCRQAGFPDRAFSRAKGDNVVFVLRKIVNGTEWGWTGSPGHRAWTSVAQPAINVPTAEERLPLMNVSTKDGRTLLFGYVPVGSRETYAAGAEVVGDPSIKYGLLTQEFGGRFTSNLVPPPGQTLSILETFPLVNTPHPNQLDMSIFILRDLVDFFETSLPAVGQALPPNSPLPPYPEAQALVTLLQKQTIKNKVTIWSALQDLWSNKPALDATGPPVVDVTTLQFKFTDDYNLVNLIKLANGQPGGIADLATQLKVAVNNAAMAAPSGTVTQTYQLPKLNGNDTYVIRLLYERTACTPVQQWLSRKSDPFQLAGIFDSDAPARNIRIAMPGNVSLAGLRKLKKNVSIIMSDEMRRKMAMVTGHEQDLVNGKPAGSDPGIGLGLICSFSIQIIFIVAFMLLLIFVILLNLVFFWLPFFKICFPIPTSAAPSEK